MADKIIELVSVDSETKGPDRLVIDYNQLVNQAISVSVGTAMGLAINKAIDRDD